MNSLYAAFDVYPAPKGAAIHIRHMAQTLFEHFEGGCLYTLGGEELPSRQQEGNIEIVRFDQPIANMLERAIAFSEYLFQHLARSAGEGLQLCHCRDPWSAFAILNYQAIATHKSFKTVYEVNALPSIELPYAFPHISPETLDKIRQQEMFCLYQVDAIITPSQKTADFLIELGIDQQKIQVIRNGAELPAEPGGRLPRPVEAPERYLIYFGAVQSWQGIDDLLRAFALLADFEPLHLVMCIAKHNRFAKQYRKMAEKLGIAERIVWHYGLEQPVLHAWVQHAEISVAPLTDCERNVVQGCCPLKVLESMCLGTTVVASDLPVVRELLNDGEHGRLVRPGRAPELARVLRVVLESPEYGQTLAKQAQAHVAENFTWTQCQQQLRRLYGELINP